MGQYTDLKGNILDDKNFEFLFNSYFDLMVSMAYRYVKDLSVAKDIVHDTFAAIWEKRSTIDLSKPVKSYLFTTVNNKSLNYIRDNKKFVKAEGADLDLESTNMNGSEIAISNEITDRVEKALNLLPDKCRSVFEMSRFEGLSYKQIAEKMGISNKTVENQMSKALKIFREVLKDLYFVLFTIFMI